MRKAYMMQKRMVEASIRKGYHNISKRCSLRQVVANKMVDGDSSESYDSGVASS